MEDNKDILQMGLHDLICKTTKIDICGRQLETRLIRVLAYRCHCQTVDDICERGLAEIISAHNLGSMAFELLLSRLQDIGITLKVSADEVLDAISKSHKSKNDYKLFCEVLNKYNSLEETEEKLANENNQSLNNLSERISQFGIRYLNNLAAEKFLEKSQTMKEIKSTIKNYLNDLKNTMLNTRNLEGLEEQEKFINDEMDLFDEIVKQKREEYARENNLEEHKNTACARISTRIDEIDTKYHHGSFIPKREKELRD